MYRLDHLRISIATVICLVCASACLDNKDSSEQGPIVIDGRGSSAHSTTAGNLIATAMQDFYKVDMVFYPSVFLNGEQFAIVEKGLDKETIQKRILPLYPDDKRDEFLIGNLSGAEIRKFIIDRSSDNYQLDLQVAGLEYDIQYAGGLPTLYQISRPRGIPLEDQRSYRVAISRQQYGIPYTFPGYQYRNGFENNLKDMLEQLKGVKDIVFIAHSLGGIYSLHIANAMSKQVGRN